MLRRLDHRVLKIRTVRQLRQTIAMRTFLVRRRAHLTTVSRTSSERTIGTIQRRRIKTKTRISRRSTVDSVGRPKASPDNGLAFCSCRQPKVVPADAHAEKKSEVSSRLYN